MYVKKKELVVMDQSRLNFFQNYKKNNNLKIFKLKFTDSVKKPFKKYNNYTDFNSNFTFKNSNKNNYFINEQIFLFKSSCINVFYF